MQKYGVSAFVYSNTAPTMLMSYHELKFLQAEALCRLNRTSDAEKALKEAVAAGIQMLKEVSLLLSLIWVAKWS